MNPVQTESMQVLSVSKYLSYGGVFQWWCHMLAPRTGTLENVCVGVEKQQVWFGLVWGLRAFGRVVLGSCYRFPLKLSVLTSGIWVGLSLQPWAVDSTTLLVSDICWEELPLLSLGPYSSESSPSTHPQLPPTSHPICTFITGQCVLLPAWT